LVLDSIGPPVRTAIGQAIARDNRHWLTIDHLRSEFGTMHMLFAGITAATVLLAAMLLPAELEIPVTGVISAANSSAIYAPAEGVVEEVLVDDGQQVSLGTPLIRLRSPELDLAQRTLEAALATAAVRLDSIQISRIGHSTRDEFSQTSLDERVLKTEIEGLQSQLALLQRQQQELLIHSPLNGRVDGWKLRSTWLARPVAVGQYLLSVLSPTEGWNVELEIPDRHVGYLLEHQRQRKCTVVFRLRSDAAVLHQGEIETIADTAQIDARGNSMVLATLPFAAAEPGQLRDGASVLAQVHCGQRSIGFVWLRGVVEWWRSSTWF
jgi:multidrug efflux pump subunit AcrA (membrane-fusion protein)